jgi:hypothetical protein
VLASVGFTAAAAAGRLRFALLFFFLLLAFLLVVFVFFAAGVRLVGGAFRFVALVFFGGDEAPVVRASFRAAFAAFSSASSAARSDNSASDANCANDFACFRTRGAGDPQAE